MRIVLVIALGGALGSVARYGMQTFFFKTFPLVFPLGTFLVNLLGCLLIGMFYALAEKGNILTPEWRLFLTTGFCGGFTTFSTFAFESVNLIKSTHFLDLALYVLGSVILGVIGVYLGILIIKPS